MMFIPVVTCLIALSPPPTQDVPPTEKTVLEPYYLEDSNLELAYRSYKRGNHPDARRRLRRIIDAPLNTNIARAARWLLIQSLEKTSSTRRGSEWRKLVTSLKEDPILMGPVHSRLGEYYQARGDKKKALDHYQRVPNNDVKTLRRTHHLHPRTLMQQRRNRCIHWRPHR